MKPYRELQVLADYQGVALAAGNTVTPQPSTIGGELDSHEVGEVAFLEVFSPLSALLVPEDLQIQLRLDTVLEQQNYIWGLQDLCVLAPKQFMNNKVIHAFGTPMWNTPGTFTGMLGATCPKFHKSLTFDCSTIGGITVGYRVRAWGYRYEGDKLATIFPGQFGTSGQIYDKAVNKYSQTISKTPLSITEDTWTQLPGGLYQATPKIWTFQRIANNNAATTPNTPYEFRYDTLTVLREREELRFEYAIQKKVAILKALGIRVTPGTAIGQTFVDVQGDERPKNRWMIREFVNPKHFGFLNAGLLSAYMGMNLYEAIPLLDDPILIDGENVSVRVVDSGVACLANSIFVAVNGTMVELT